jgi:hypothetical protein
MFPYLVSMLLALLLAVTSSALLGVPTASAHTATANGVANCNDWPVDWGSDGRTYAYVTFALDECSTHQLENGDSSNNILVGAVLGILVSFANPIAGSITGSAVAYASQQQQGYMQQLDDQCGDNGIDVTYYVSWGNISVTPSAQC